jgi:hypothetical protein
LGLLVQPFQRPGMLVLVAAQALAQAVMAFLQALELAHLAEWEGFLTVYPALPASCQVGLCG